MLDSSGVLFVLFGLESAFRYSIALVDVFCIHCLQEK